MDRVDCQFMMASFVYVYYITIVKPNYLPTGIFPPAQLFDFY